VYLVVRFSYAVSPLCQLWDLVPLR